MYYNLRCCVLALLSLLLPAVAGATLVDGGEYYIMNNYYGLLLGLNTDGTSPRLTAFGTAGEADSYVCVAEQSGSEGWWLLRNKQTGRYLKASTADTWSLSWSESRGTGNEFLWKLDVRLGASIVSKKSTDKRLGCDWTEAESVPVYYDKPASSRALWSVFPALEEGYEASLQQASTDFYVNAQGVKEKDFWQIASDMTLDGEGADIHIVGDVPFTDEGMLRLSDEQSWVVFDHVAPSVVISTYLSHLRFNERRAINGTNVRVAIWKNGAAVIPCRSSDNILTGYTEPNQEGQAMQLKAKNYKVMGVNSNRMRSFVLKRGYMATMASGENGSGYSRVYVADHADIVVDLLPEQLDRRISSIYIRPWQYVGKKGWCSTQASDKIADQMTRLHASWFYTWSADRKTTDDHEYVPIRQHIYWPSLSQINGLSTSTHVLGINEPEHSEQHTSAKCGCGGAIDSWKATTLTPDLLEGGMRIGSPSPTDMSWLYEYIGHCDDMTYRCDFVAIHAYWGPNEANGVSAWYNQLKEIYDKTKRPIWITEWAYGASWTSESWPSNYSEQMEKNRAAVMDIVDMLERCPFVERYSYYQWDTSSRRFINDDGWMTPAGRVYRDTETDFAYRSDMQYIPHWWRPSTQKSTLTSNIDLEAGTITFIMGNTNGDCTDSFVLQRISQDGTTENLYEVSNRSELEKKELRFTLPLDNVNRETDSFRILATTLFGGDASSDVLSLAYIRNGHILTSSKSNVDGWTCQRSAANGYTKDASGDTYLEVWNETPDGMYFDYYQDVNNLPEGMYRLSAACFNSTNGVDGAEVNGSVCLYAQADGLEYLGSVDVDAEIDYDHPTVIENVVVHNGTMRVGIKNVAPMTARWAGADNFLLEYVGPIADVLDTDFDSFLRAKVDEHDALLKRFFTELSDGQDEAYDASCLIINPDCTRKDTYGWLIENIATLTGQAYDGVAGNPYWDKWQSGGLSSSLSQTLTQLPAGDYVLSALIRAKTGMTFTLAAEHTHEGYSQSYSVDGIGVGDQTQSGSDYKNGWIKMELPVITVQHGDLLTITARINANTTCWWSVDHFGLTWKASAPIPDGMELIDNGQLIIDNGAVYDLQGRRVDTQHSTLSPPLSERLRVGDGTSGMGAGGGLLNAQRSWLPKGIYIQNRKKILIK